jgi:hypothetical protein
MGEDWEIRYTHRDVVRAHDGLIDLEWKLNRVPESEWRKYFISSQGGKSGTGDFLSRVPQLEGNKIIFTVSEEDLEKAVVYVESKIDGANQLFNTYVISRRREQESQRQAEEAWNERRLQEARQRLERLKQE